MARQAYWIFGAMALWILALGQANGKPAIEVNLASTTAWTFRPDGATAKAKTLPVPAGGWRLNGFPNATAGTYERKITVPRLPGGGQQVTLLAFEAVNWEATVSVGPDSAHLKEVGKHLSAWTPFRMDISRFVTPGQTSLLRVRVRDRNAFKDKDGRFTVPAGVEWNDRQGRGILRGVSLAVYPRTYISDVFVKPDTANNALSYEVTVVNAGNTKRTVMLGGQITPATPGAHWSYPVLPLQTITLLPGETGKGVYGPLPWKAGRASWWWPNVPFREDYRAQLHTLTLEMRGEPNTTGTLLQTEAIRFGFCTPGQKGNRYTFNGVPFPLRGDSLPEGTLGTDAFARLPGFLPASQSNPGWPGAVRNYQRLNYNVLRMHQAPATRYMMNVCDELGMLVIPETAIRGGGGKKQNIDVLPDAFTTHLRELVLRDRNHPSVFKWSLENELFGAPEPFLRKLYDTCREADPTRPCSIDDNADAPAWPGFAVIEHDSQPPGTPDAPGGRPRTDRPFGQGEYVWPHGAQIRGPLWFSLITRALRIHDNADIRPYTLIDVWPGVIPGLSPTNFPDPHLPPDSLEQGGRSLLDFEPGMAWTDLRIQMLQRSFAPLAVYDPDYDNTNIDSNGRGEWPTRLPQLDAGKTVTRTLEIFNNDLEGEKITLFLLPALRTKKLEEGAFKDEQEALPEIVREVTVPLGGHLRVPIEIPLPKVTQNTALELTLTAWKDGKERYRETLPFVIVPEGKEGTRTRYEGRDERTHGDWVDAQGKRIYGQQAFFVAITGGRSAFQSEEAQIRRVLEIPTIPVASGLVDEMADQDGYRKLDKAITVNDSRLPWNGPDRSGRNPVVLQGLRGTLRLRVDTTDAQPHRLSLYLLDYFKKGESVDIDIFDQAGHRLDSRHVENYKEGVYLQYRITGTVYVAIHSLSQQEPLLAGVFVDPV